MQSILRFDYLTKGEMDKRPPSPSWFWHLTYANIDTGRLSCVRIILKLLITKYFIWKALDLQNSCQNKGLSKLLYFQTLLCYFKVISNYTWTRTKNSHTFGAMLPLHHIIGVLLQNFSLIGGGMGTRTPIHSLKGC